MPLKRCGSVSARFSVWFSRAQRRCELRPASTLEALRAPPGSSAASAASPRTTCSERLLARSGLGEQQRTVGEIERREADLRRNRRARSRQRRRPAIIRCMTRNRSSSSVRHDALADAARPRDRLALDSAPAADRRCGRRTDCCTRTRSSGRPITRGRSALRYSSMSGSSGIARGHSRQLTVRAARARDLYRHHARSDRPACQARATGDRPGPEDLRDQLAARERRAASRRAMNVTHCVR